MKRIFHVAASAAAVCALAGAPAFAQSSGSASGGSAQSGSGATDQAGSQPGSHAGNEGVTGTSPRGDDQSGTTGTSGQAKAGASASSAAGKASATDRAFVAKAAAGGMAEVKLGELASEKATNADVKKFGQMMVDDHTKANTQLMSIAQQSGVTAPKDLKPQDQAFYDRLSKMSGDEFDHAYMRHMVTDHQKDVAEFKKASTSASDSAVKQFATDTLPVLEKHLQDAQSITKKIGGGAEATSGTSPAHHKGTGTSGASDHHGSGSGTGSGSGAGSGAGSGSTPPRPPQQ